MRTFGVGVHGAPTEPASREGLLRQRVPNLIGDPEDTMTFPGGVMRVTGVCMCDTSLMPSVPFASQRCPRSTPPSHAPVAYSSGMATATMLDERPPVGTQP
jgi:hypothetical protein